MNVNRQSKRNEIDEKINTMHFSIVPLILFVLQSFVGKVESFGSVCVLSSECSRFESPSRVRLAIYWTGFGSLWWPTHPLRHRRTNTGGRSASRGNLHLLTREVMVCVNGCVRTGSINFEIAECCLWKVYYEIMRWNKGKCLPFCSI